MELEGLKPTRPLNDYQLLATDLVRLLRGERTQRELSEQLGYSFNQVAKWEKGFTQIKWGDFLALAGVLGIPVEKHFRTVFWTFNGPFDAETSVRGLMHQLKLNPGRSRGARMDLADVLRLMDTNAAILVSWLCLFADCEKLPTIRPAYEAFVLRLTAVLSDPLCVFVNAALEVESYKNAPAHDEALLAEHATCSVAELRRILATLVTFEAAVYDGTRYRPTFLFEYSFSPNPKLRTLTKYATDLASQRYSLEPLGGKSGPPTNTSVSSVRVVAMSPEVSRQVRDRVAHFHAEIGELVKNDHSPKDHVQVIILHSFVSNINRPPEKTETNS